DEAPPAADLRGGVPALRGSRLALALTVRARPALGGWGAVGRARRRRLAGGWGAVGQVRRRRRVAGSGCTVPGRALPRWAVRVVLLLRAGLLGAAGVRPAGRPVRLARLLRIGTLRARVLRTGALLSRARVLRGLALGRAAVRLLRLLRAGLPRARLLRAWLLRARLLRAGGGRLPGGLRGTRAVAGRRGGLLRRGLVRRAVHRALGRLALAAAELARRLVGVADGRDLCPEEPRPQALGSLAAELDPVTTLGQDVTVDDVPGTVAARELRDVRHARAPVSDPRTWSHNVRCRHGTRRRRPCPRPRRLPCCAACPAAPLALLREGRRRREALEGRRRPRPPGRAVVGKLSRCAVGPARPDAPSSSALRGDRDLDLVPLGQLVKGCQAHLDGLGHGPHVDQRPRADVHDVAGAVAHHDRERGARLLGRREGHEHLRAPEIVHLRRHAGHLEPRVGALLAHEVAPRIDLHGARQEVCALGLEDPRDDPVGPAREEGVRGPLPDHGLRLVEHADLDDRAHRLTLELGRVEVRDEPRVLAV